MDFQAISILIENLSWKIKLKEKIIRSQSRAAFWAIFDLAIDKYMFNKVTNSCHVQLCNKINQLCGTGIYK